MKRFLAIIVFLGMSVGLIMAQLRVPDNEDILARTIDSSSPYYYPTLFSRYMADDQTLTDDDYYYLYYGYAYSDRYKPFKAIPAEANVLSVMERSGETPTVTQMEDLVRYAREVMQADPFSPKNLNFLVYGYGALGDTLRERIYYDKMQHVLRTIENSGTGVKENSPKHILMFSHAADVLYSRGLDIKRREVVSRTAEYIFLPEKDSLGNKGYYFDFSRIYWERPDEVDLPQKERRWQINDMPLKKNK